LDNDRYKEIESSYSSILNHLNEEATSKRDLQCRLNPIMQEAGRAEIIKILDNGIIYPIYDS